MSQPAARRGGGLGIRRSGWLNLAAVVVLLLLVNLVPQDTSLSEVRRTGLLRACVPSSYPPLVTGDPAAPGYDIEILEEIARRLDLRLVKSVNASIGQDFNPRNWRITRAQCEIIAGGVVQSPITRGFLQTLSTGVATGWVIVAPDLLDLASGMRLAVLPGSGRLDRIGLSAYLRELGVGISLVRTPAALAEAVAGGTVAGGVAERFQAREAMLDHPDWDLTWLATDTLPAYPLALGLWKGDTTFKRAVDREMQAMDADGTLARLREKYAMACPVSSNPPPGVDC